jgi:CRISPR-associated protein Csx17
MLARALSTIGLPAHPASGPPIRANLEPISLRRTSDGWRVDWNDEQRADVWSYAGLCPSLAAVLERRLRDAYSGRTSAPARSSGESLPVLPAVDTGAEDRPHPLRAIHCAGPSAVLALLAEPSSPHPLDEIYAADLLWAMTAVSPGPPDDAPPADLADAPLLPRSYALLKLLFLPQPIHTPAGVVRVPFDPQVVTMLRARRVPEACRRAMQLLRSAGLRPMPHPTSGGIARDRDWDDPCASQNGLRLAAALLVPLHPFVIEAMQNLVLRPVEEQWEADDDMLAANGSTAP